MADNDKPPEGVGFHEVPPSKEGLEALAALVGMTNAKLKELDENVVDKSNHNIRAQKWDPKAILRNYADQAKTHPKDQSTHAPEVPPQPGYDIPPVPLSTDLGFAEPLTTSPPAALIPAQNPQVEIKLDLILKKLEHLEESYSMITKLLENNLKNKIKTITFKLNDQSKDT